MERSDPAAPGAVAGLAVGALKAAFQVGALLAYRAETVAEIEAAFAAYGIETGLSATAVYWISVGTAAVFPLGLGLVVGSLLGVAYDWFDRPGLAALAGAVVVVGVVDGLLTDLPAPRAVTVGATVVAWLLYLPLFARLYDPTDGAEAPTGVGRARSTERVDAGPARSTGAPTDAGTARAADAPETTRSRLSEDAQVGAVLAVLGLGGVALSLPYVVAVQPGPAGAIALSHAFTVGTLTLAAVVVGLRLGPAVDLGAPAFRALVAGESPPRETITRPAAAGVGLGVLTVGLDRGFLALEGGREAAAAPVAVWRRALLVPYGGVTEELLVRFGLLTALAWVGTRLRGRDSPSRATVWAAVLLAALAFGAAHLPVAATGGLTALEVGRILSLNGIAGVVFGWFYWRRGLLAAMVAHLGANLVLHVAVPLAAGGA